jgi:uncharacterized protein (DUF427 family)
MQAIYNETIIADSIDVVLLEGHRYFPIDSVRQEYLVPSITHSICPWKGRASYYTLSVNGSIALNAAWYYRDPTSAASSIKGRIAFGDDVTILPSTNQKQ